MIERRFPFIAGRLIACVWLPAMLLATPAAGQTRASDEGPPAPAGPQRRAAIDEFEWSSVSHSVQAIFGASVDIGKGIRALLTSRIQKAGQIRVVERANAGTLTREQEFGQSTRTRRGSGPAIGQMLGADVYLLGEVVVFGRDDKDKRVSLGDIGFGGPFGGIKVGSKEDRAVVVLSYRIADAETGEILDTGEARGESARKSKGVSGLFGSSRGIAGGGIDMTSRNFEQTIIGEAVIAAADQLAHAVNSKAPSLPARGLDIEARVADVSESGLTIAGGTGDGIAVGQRYDVFRIVAEIKDPVTGEVLDNKVEHLGELVIVMVRERIAEGSYRGAPVPSKGGLARLRR